MSERIIVLRDGTMLTIIFETLEKEISHFHSEAEALRAFGICERLGIFVEEMDLGDGFIAGYQKLLKDVMVEMNLNTLVR